MLEPVTIAFSMRCNPRALAGRKAALGAAVEAALSKVVAEFQGQEFRVAWTRVGPSNDTLQRVLSLVLQHVKPEGAALCFQVCHPASLMWMPHAHVHLADVLC